MQAKTLFRIAILLQVVGWVLLSQYMASVMRLRQTWFSRWLADNYGAALLVSLLSLILLFAGGVFMVLYLYVIIFHRNTSAAVRDAQGKSTEVVVVQKGES